MNNTVYLNLKKETLDSCSLSNDIKDEKTSFHGIKPCDRQNNAL